MKKQNFSDNNCNHTVYLSIGSNLGNRKENIIRGFSLLSELLEDIETSSLYETEPMYVTDQPLFLNTVFKGKCLLSPDKLLEKIHDIESELGRNRVDEVFKGPRPLDIDILLYGDLIIDETDLKIPHPGIKDRLFVLKPLLELDNHLSDPITGINYTENIKSLDDEGIYYFESCRYIENQIKKDKKYGTESR